MIEVPSTKEAAAMGPRKNLHKLKPSACLILKRGLQLSAYLLLLGCIAIRRGALDTADLLRDLSAASLLLAELLCAYIELRP